MTEQLRKGLRDFLGPLTSHPFGGAILAHPVSSACLLHDRGRGARPRGRTRWWSNSVASNEFVSLVRRRGRDRMCRLPLGEHLHILGVAGGRVHRLFSHWLVHSLKRQRLRGWRLRDPCLSGRHLAQDQGSAGCRHPAQCHTEDDEDCPPRLPGLGAGATSWARMTCMNSAGFDFHFMAS